MPDRPTTPANGCVLELRVRNHPGTMSHITGLFARRAFNLESILCAPNRDDEGATSTILLAVAAEPPLEQVERQLLRLHDVLSVRHRDDLRPTDFPAVLASLGRVSAQGEGQAAPGSRNRVGETL